MIIIAVPLIPVLAALVAFFSRRLNIVRIVSVLGSAVTLILTLIVAQQITQHFRITVLPHWVGVNGLSALILVLQSFVAFTATVYSWGYMKRVTSLRPQRQQHFYVNLNLFLASLFMVPIFLQPALTWVAVELTTVLSVFLVGFENTPKALEAAWKYAVITIMGATVAVLGIFLLLWGLLNLHVSIQTWNTLKLAAPRIPLIQLKLAFVLIFIGFGTKVGIVPMHTWLPDAHSQAPTPVCALLSGIEVSTILYVIMRLWPVFEQIPGGFAQNWALVFGLISVGTAALLMIQVRDFKRLFAFSTVEQMGILLVGLGLGPAGHYAMLYQLLTHAFTKSLVFYSAGTAFLATSTLDIASVRGLIRISPIAAGSLLLSGLAIAGAPPFAVFLSELSIFRAALISRHVIVLALLLAFLTLAFFGVMRHLNHMVFGQPSHPPITLPHSVVLTLVISWIPVLAFGLYLPISVHHLLTLTTLALRR